MLSSGAQNLNWLMQDFTQRVTGINEAIVVSSDGLLIAASSGLDRASADRFAAASSTLINLAGGLAAEFQAGLLSNVIIEMEKGMLFASGISEGSCLVAITDAPDRVDWGLIAYEMTTLVQRVGEVLTPEIRSELQNSLPSL